MRHNFLALSLIATLSLISAVCGAVESTHELSIRGLVFVVVVFPVLELNQDRMDTVETILDAYSFWGRQIISMTM